MTSKNEIPSRAEIPENMQWDLAVLYASPEEWEKDFKKIDSLLKKLLAFRNRLGESAETLAAAFRAEDELDLLLERLYVYAHLKSDEDTGNSVNNGRQDRISCKSSDIEGATAWFEPELLAIPKEIFDAMKRSDALSFYTRTLEESERGRAHTLSAAEERILGMSSEIFSNPHKSFSMLNDADLRFPKIKDASGDELEVTHGNYIKLLENPERRIRKDAFEALYDTYSGLKNTFAALLDGTVKASVLDAKIRQYPSSLAASLFSDNVPLSVYEGLISSVHRNLAPLHRYFELRAKALKLPKINMYDIHNPLVPDAKMEIPWEEAVCLVKDSLLPLGGEYCSSLENAFREHWIDVRESRGKRSGAYSSGCYRKPPYILLNFTGTLDSVFTLSHELGHSMHSYFSDRAQDFHYASYRIFVAEVASTTNELLLHHHLMKTASDDSVRAYLLNHLIDGIRGTVYRQTMFAEFERDIHAMAESGEPLTADALCEHYFKLNARYHGPAVEPDARIQYEWERIPHFHYNFYVYKYATGMSAAAALSQDILNGKTDAYLNFLKAGDSKDVIDIMKDAGVDFSSDAPVAATMRLFDETVESLRSLLPPS